MKNILFSLIFTILTIKGAIAMNKENTLLLELKNGVVTIEMLPEAAPKHVARIKELVNQGFYDGLKFHRVIEGFMAQTGDPLGNGTGGSGQNIEAEFNAIPHTRGILSMARAMDPNSADSQFFIMFEDSPHLDGQYTVWGKITDGLELIDDIKRGDGPNGAVLGEPDKIISMKMAK